VIAYSHCIAHGYDMAFGVDQQKAAVGSGIWPLYRYDPRRVKKGEPPLHLDSGAPKSSIGEYFRAEGRFRVVEKADPQRFARLLKTSEKVMRQRYAVYQQLAGITVPLFDGLKPAGEPDGAAAAGAPTTTTTDKH